MASKSKDVRIEQLRVFEKKLALRLQQLDQKGISKEKAQKDTLVKSLKSKIKETNARIAVFDKFVQRAQEFAQVKAQKLADLAENKEAKSEPKPAEPKQKKADKESKKKPVASGEEAPKKPKKQQADTNEEAPKKRTGKKEE